MSALISIMPVSRRDVWLSESVATIALSKPVTVPVTALGVPPSPPALPTATMPSPTLTVDELATVIFLRLLALRSWMTAMSCERSKPTTLALNVRPLPTSTALIWVPPAITWLLVRTRPLEVSTMPVPALPVLELPSRTLMLTTAGLTLATIWAGLSRLGDGAADGAAALGSVGTLTWGPLATCLPFWAAGWALNTNRNAPSPSSGARLKSSRPMKIRRAVRPLLRAGGAEIGGYPRHCGGRGYGTGPPQAGKSVTG